MAGRIGTQVNLDHSAFSYRGPRQVSGIVFYDYQNKNGEMLLALQVYDINIGKRVCFTF